MSASSIEWTDATWNPVRGCSRVSEGCRNCYAERMAARNLPEMRSPTTGKPFAVRGSDGPHWTGAVELIPSKLAEPLHWRKPRRVFVNSMSDLFHEGLLDEAIDRVFAVMTLAPRHTFQILTKRPERMLTYMADRARSAEPWKKAAPFGWTLADYAGIPMIPFPLPNVWLGVSVEDQATADERIPLLLQTPAAKRFISQEPQLAPVVHRPEWLGADCERCQSCGRRYREVWWCDDASVWRRVVGRGDGGLRCPACFTREATALRLDPQIKVMDRVSALDWVIVGGESGPGARPFDVAWARETVRQCKAAGVACFIKQMGRWVLGDHEGFAVNQFLLPDGGRYIPALLPSRFRRPDEAIGFSLHDPKGGEPLAWPEDLRVREFPA